MISANHYRILCDTKSSKKISFYTKEPDITSAITIMAAHDVQETELDKENWKEAVAMKSKFSTALGPLLNDMIDEPYTGDAPQLERGETLLSRTSKEYFEPMLLMTFPRDSKAAKIRDNVFDVISARAVKLHEHIPESKWEGQAMIEKIKSVYYPKESEDDQVADLAEAGLSSTKASSSSEKHSASHSPPPQAERERVFLPALPEPEYEKCEIGEKDLEEEAIEEAEADLDVVEEVFTSVPYDNKAAFAKRKLHHLRDDLGQIWAVAVEHYTNKFPTIKENLEPFLERNWTPQPTLEGPEPKKVPLHKEYDRLSSGMFRLIDAADGFAGVVEHDTEAEDDRYWVHEEASVLLRKLEEATGQGKDSSKRWEKAPINISELLAKMEMGETKEQLKVRLEADEAHEKKGKKHAIR